jgi:cyclic pyranopterin phosphate synthase
VLVSKLCTINGLKDIALTTNAVLLASQAEPLYRAGLRRLNVHLDTLDRQRFIDLTRRDELGRVLRGLAAAHVAGFSPIKINAVAVRGYIEHDLVPLARFGREQGYEVRFIEFMPLDAQGLWDRARVFTMDEMLAMLAREIGPLEPLPADERSEVSSRAPRAPALEYQYLDSGGRVGFIASVSRPFCGDCNRIRLTANGKLRYCLFAREETDILGILRGGGSDGDIATLLRSTVHAKWEGHGINTAQFVPPPRPMYSIGG